MRKYLSLIAIVIFFALCSACPAQTHTAALSWGASTTPSMAYKVQRRLNVTGAVYSTVFTTAIGIVAYTDSGLSANTGYCYQVRTTDPSGAMVDSTPTAEVCGTTLKDATNPPAGAVTVIFN